MTAERAPASSATIQALAIFQMEMRPAPDVLTGEPMPLIDDVEAGVAGRVHEIFDLGLRVVPHARVDGSAERVERAGVVMPVRGCRDDPLMSVREMAQLAQIRRARLVHRSPRKGGAGRVKGRKPRPANTECVLSTAHH